VAWLVVTKTVYIFDPALEESAITERLERFHALLTKDSKGSLQTSRTGASVPLPTDHKRKTRGF